MIPLKCFNCGCVGHFASKCPHKNKDSDEEKASKGKKYQKGNKRIHKRKLFKKSFYSKEDSSSSDEEDNDSDSDSERVIFMEIEDDS
jgi:hypothetical protein